MKSSPLDRPPSALSGWAWASCAAASSILPKSSWLKESSGCLKDAVLRLGDGSFRSHLCRPAGVL
jgi:hypothetical protein